MLTARVRPASETYSFTIVSKAGYVQGQALTMARAREQGGAAFPEI